MLIVYLVTALITFLSGIAMFHHPKVREKMQETSLSSTEIDAGVYFAATLLSLLASAIWPVTLVLLLGYLFYKGVFYILPSSWRRSRYDKD